MKMEVESGTKTVQPIAGALFKKKAKLNIIPPVKNNQNPTAFKYGKAKSLAPICNGTATFIKPRSIGVAAKKIIIVPCVVNTSSYLRSEEHTSELQSRFDLVCRL